MGSRIAQVFSAGMLLALVLTPVALGQARATAPVALGGMDVQVWPEAEPGQTVVIASLTIDEKTKLPATVRIPVIEGMQVQWVGEISGGDASQDPTRTYTTEEGTGGRYVEFEASQYRFAQVEMIGLPVTPDGDRTKVAAEWVQSVPSTITAFSVRTIPGVRDVRITPVPVGAPDENQTGERLYTLPSKELKPGQKATVSVEYASGTQFEGGLDGAGNTNTIIGVLLAGIALAVVFLVWMLGRQRRAS